VIGDCETLYISGAAILAEDEQSTTASGEAIIAPSQNSSYAFCSARHGMTRLPHVSGRRAVILTHTEVRKPAMTWYPLSQYNNMAAGLKSASLPLMLSLPKDVKVSHTRTPFLPPAVILLSFVLAVGFLMIILSCALWSNWLPLFVGSSSSFLPFFLRCSPPPAVHLADTL
jgi:hypothetical protein